MGDTRPVHDRAFMAHELKHVQRYERLSTDGFWSKYTTNSWIFENESIDEQARVAAERRLRRDTSDGCSP